MPYGYQTTIWAKKYRHLETRERKIVNEQANHVFRERTSVSRKLDPRRDKALCRQWLEIRDEVMERRARSGGFPGVPYAKQVVQTVQRGVGAVGGMVESLLRSEETPWIEVAQAERQRGVAMIAGKEAHPRIMMYSQTCPHLYSTANKTKFMERKGDEALKWCSAFVNWCLLQTGIVGTRHALAMSWLKWGEPISEPQHGAIIVTKSETWNHVAFVEETGGEFKQLGGNQRPEHGSGQRCVSYQDIIPSQVVGYRMPPAG